MLTREQRRVFSDLEDILRGRTGKSLSIGIITAENSNGKSLPDSENNRRNLELLKTLQSIPNVKIYPIQGNFEGVQENSFLVTGIQLEKLKELSRKFEQLAFIYGTGSDDNMLFRYFENIKGRYSTSQVRRTFLYNTETETNYSSYKGVKFIIPFFNDDYVNVKWSELSPSERGVSGGEEYPESDNPNGLKESKFNKINRLIKSISIDEEDIEIRVNHSDLLELPKGKEFWQVPFKHYINLVEKRGQEKVLRSLENIKVWNKNDDPKILKHADSLISKLKDDLNR